MASDDFFEISNDVIQEAEAASKFSYVIPETARGGKGGEHYWFEAGVVSSAQQSIDNNGIRTHKIFQVNITISAEGSGKNIGKPITAFMRVNQDAMKKKSPQGQVTMSNLSIHKMNTLFRSLGIQGEREDGGYSNNQLLEYFPRDTSFEKEASPLVNRIVYFEIKQPAPGTMTKQGKPAQTEVTKFIPSLG